MRLSLTLSISCTLLLFLAGACIPVDDLGEYWDKGTIDPALEGHWRKADVEFRSQDEFLSFVKSGDHYVVESLMAESPERKTPLKVKARTLVSGKHNFLMLFLEEHDAEETKVQPANASEKLPGFLQRYRVRGDTLRLFFLDDQVLADAVKRKRVKGRIESQAMPWIYLKALDRETIKLIVELADDRAHWERVERYVRVENLEEALKRSRTYPATKDTPQNTLVNINLPDLQYFAEGKADAIMRHLRATPEWRVYAGRDIITCDRRVRTDDGWLVKHGGWRTENDADLHASFWFSERAGGPVVDEYDRSSFTKAEPLNGEIHLSLSLSDVGIASSLVVGQEGLWFEFLERSWEEERNSTRTALVWLEGFLKALRDAEKEIGEKGYASKLMPDDGVKKGTPSIQVIDGSQLGIYEVFAWANPGRDGSVYLKVFKVDTNAPLSVDSIEWESREYIGWSGDPEEQFFYNSNITVGEREGDRDHLYDARFELWFHSKDDGAEEKLVQMTRKINGWQR